MNKKNLCLSILFLILCSSCFSSPVYPPKNLTGKKLQLLVTKAGDYTDSTKQQSIAFKFTQANKYLVYIDGKLTQTGYFTYKRRKSNTVKIICTYKKDHTPASYDIILVFQDETSGTWEWPHQEAFAGTYAGDFILE